MLQNPLHVAHTSALSGPAQKVTKVRISISPPASLKCRETAPSFAPKYARHARISQYVVSKVNRRERTARDRMASICGPFSGGHIRSPVSVTLSGEGNAITNRWCGESDLTWQSLCGDFLHSESSPTIISASSTSEPASTIRPFEHSC